MFGQTNGQSKLATSGPTGPELMLRSLGLGEVIEAAKAFASAGTMQKIMAFADAVEPLAAAVAENNRRLANIERALGISADAGEFRPAEPGSSPGIPEPDGLSAGPEHSVLAEHRAA